MKRFFIKYPLFYLVLLVIVFKPAIALAEDPQMITFKAISLIRFINYIDVKNDKIDICIIGDNQVLIITKKINETKQGRSKANAVREITTKESSGCSLIYVSNNSNKASDLISLVGDKNIITVSDKAGFAASGGIIELFEDEGKIKFAINLRLASKNKINIDSRLIEAADRVM